MPAQIKMSPPVRSLAAVAMLLVESGGVCAQSVAAWPARPVTIVAPLQPGAATEIETRLYAQKLTDNIGRPVVVDYKPGAGSTIEGYRTHRRYQKHFTRNNFIAASSLTSVAPSMMDCAASMRSNGSRCLVSNPPALSACWYETAR